MAFRDAGIEAVVFDWGGTLSTHATSVRVEELWRPAAAVLEAHTPHSARRSGRASPPPRTTSGNAPRRISAPAPSPRSSPRRATGSASTCPDEALEAAALAYLDAWEPHIEHDTQGPPTLEAMRAAGLRTAMLSNTHWPREYHERFLVRDGLAHLLDARVYTCELDYMKPHPAAFEAALAAVGVSDPARAVYVGDRPFDDIFGARRAGLRTALRTNPRVPAYDVAPDVEIGGLPELLTHLGLEE